MGRFFISLISDIHETSRIESIPKSNLWFTLIGGKKYIQEHEKMYKYILSPELNCTQTNLYANQRIHTAYGANTVIFFPVTTPTT